MQKEEKRRRLRELFNLLGVCRVIKTDALYIQLAEPFGEDLFLTLHRRVFAVAYEGLPHNHLALDNFLTAVTLGESWSDSPTMKLDDDNTLSRLHWDTVPKRRARTGEFWRAIRLRMSLYRDHSRSVIWKELRTLRLRAAWRAYRFHRAATRWLADSGWIDGLWGRYRPNVPGGMSVEVCADSPEGAVARLKKTNGGRAYGMYPQLFQDWMEAGQPVKQVPHRELAGQPGERRMTR